MNNIMISLSHHWSVYNTNELEIHFIGYIKFKDKNILKADDLFENFSRELGSNDFGEFLKKDFLPFCNGNFAMGRNIISYNRLFKKLPN